MSFIITFEYICHYIFMLFIMAPLPHCRHLLLSLVSFSSPAVLCSFVLHEFCYPLVFLSFLPLLRSPLSHALLSTPSPSFG